MHERERDEISRDKTWIRMSHHPNTQEHCIASTQFGTFETRKNRNPIERGIHSCCTKAFRHLISFRYRFSIRMRAERFFDDMQSISLSFSFSVCAFVYSSELLPSSESSFFFGCSLIHLIFSPYFFSHPWLWFRFCAAGQT